MRIASGAELPPGRVDDLHRARKLAWWAIVFMITTIVLIYLTLGSSQAMRAAWIEDLVSLVPPAAFLIASRFRDREPDAEHKYGYHRAVSVAYLFSSIVLLGMGMFILFESAMTLIRQEHPTIGSVTLFGHTVWLGWLMIGALASTIGPAVILGRLQMPVAQRLHDKALYAIARMLKADWGTATAGIVGILGIGLGLWWADAIAAILISGDILHDGWTNTTAAIRDLADGNPKLVDGSASDPLPARIQTELKKLGWIRETFVRLRDEGHVFFGEALVVPTGSVDPSQIEEAVDRMKELDWRLHELVISPVEAIEISYEGTADIVDSEK